LLPEIKHIFCAVSRFACSNHSRVFITVQT